MGYQRFHQFIKVYFSQDIKWNFPAFKMILRAISCFGLCVALLGPYWGDQTEDTKVLGRQFFLLLDVSASMNTTDVAPSRLGKAKDILKQIVQSLKGDKFGIILFTSRAYVHCPMTQDYDAINLFLEMAETSLFEETGTSFRRGLGLALERFMALPELSSHTTKAIVLVSDGEDFGDTYTSVISRLQESHVKLYPIGIGTKEGGFVPQNQINSQRDNFAEGSESGIVSFIKDQSLKRMANAFETPYTWIYEPYQQIDPLIEELENLNTSPIASKINKVKRNRYQYFLILSLFCWIVSMILKPVKP